MRTADYSDDKSITLSYAGDSADSGKEFIADIGFTGFDSIPETVEVYYFDEQGERWNWPCEVSDGNTLTLTNECVLEDSDNAGITGENMHDFSDAFGFLDFTVTANWSEADGTITFNTYSYFDSGTGQQEERPVNIVFTKQQ